MWENVPFINSFAFDLVDKDGNNLRRNKGIWEVKTWLAQQDSMLVTRWLSGNMPYIGYGSWSDGIEPEYAGLSLFNSTDTKQFVTWGKTPVITEGRLFLRVEVPTGVSIDVKRLWESGNKWIDLWR
jgi:hypothetical protein